MSITSFSPTATDIAGRVAVAIGAGFANVNAPKLSELSLNVTAAIVTGVNGSTSVSTKEFQYYDDLSATESFDKRVRKLDGLEFYVDAASKTAFDTLVGEDKLIGLFFRPYTLSTTALATTDKGTAWNATVRAVDWGNTAIGNKYTYAVQLSDVSRSTALETALSA